MTLRIFTLLCLLGSCVQLATAQNELDALRHSQTMLFGHPRALGMGGAYSAVGGDLSSATLNPAGLGVFRRSKFDFTLDYRFINSELSMLDQTNLNSTNSFRVPAMGFAFQKDLGYQARDGEGLLSYTFAFGYQQKENYLNNTRVEQAYNPLSSVSTSFAELAQGTNFNELAFDERTDLAFQSYVIDLVQNVQGDSTYFGAADRGQIYQSVYLEESGLRREWYAAFGANVSDRLYFGFSASVEEVRYEQYREIYEQDLDDVYNMDAPFVPDPQLDFTELAIVDTFSTRGSGVSASMGLIYRPTDALRIGLSANVPTVFNLTDVFDYSIFNCVNLDLGNGPEEVCIDTLPVSIGTFSYQVRTPARFTLGAMYQIGKLGFISGDLEYLNYANARLRTRLDGSSAFNIENLAIQNQFQSALNARIGGEARLNIFRLRAGFAYYGSQVREPFRQYSDGNGTISQIDDPRLFFTLGAGVRQPNFSFDVSLVNQRQQSKFNPYLIADSRLFSPTAVNLRSITSISASMGFAW